MWTSAVRSSLDFVFMAFRNMAKCEPMIQTEKCALTLRSALLSALVTSYSSPGLTATGSSSSMSVEPDSVASNLEALSSSGSVEAWQRRRDSLGDRALLDLRLVAMALSGSITLVDGRAARVDRRTGGGPFVTNKS